MDTLILAMAQQVVIEAPREADQMAWVGYGNSILNWAEKIILNEYQFDAYVFLWEFDDKCGRIR